MKPTEVLTVWYAPWIHVKRFLAWDTIKTLWDFLKHSLPRKPLQWNLSETHWNLWNLLKLLKTPWNPWIPLKPSGTFVSLLRGPWFFFETFVSVPRNTINSHWIPLNPHQTYSKSFSLLVPLQTPSLSKTFLRHSFDITLPKDFCAWIMSVH